MGVPPGEAWGSVARRVAMGDGRAQMRSTMVAMPMPPPTQRVIRP